MIVFHITVVCFIFLPRSIVHATQPVDVTSFRKTFEITNAFDHYSNTCESFCGSADKILSPNVCPKCSERYSHCNHCCAFAASSLKIRWHGSCAGNLTIGKVEDVDNVCQSLLLESHENSNIQTHESSAGFISCSCYKSYLDNGHMDDGCMVSNQTNIVKDEELCVVALKSGDIDLSQSLPNPLILKHASKLVDELHPDRNEDLITAINTACGENEPPLFPGYGKFANTCPNQGAIDLGYSEVPLPHTIDYYPGEPPREIMWYEFIDGTSTGFWPLRTDDNTTTITDSTSGIRRLPFDPTFATCSCTECPTSTPSKSPSKNPTTSPSKIPSMAPSNIPTEISTTRNTRQEVLGCSPSSYESCISFSQTFCVGNGQGSIPFGEACSYSPGSVRNPLQRKLHDLESIIEYVEVNGLDDAAFIQLQKVFHHDQLVREELTEWLQSEREYHRHEYNKLVLNV